MDEENKLIIYRFGFTKSYLLEKAAAQMCGSLFIYNHSL